MKQLRITTAGASSAGIKEENQDAWVAEVPAQSSVMTHKGAVLALADGVSACTEARRASHTSISSFTSDYYSTPDSWTARHSAAKILSALNRWLYQQGHTDPRDQGSWCTTFTAMILKSATVHLVHTGDSRAWRLRNGELECLTRDHTAIMGGRYYLGKALGMSPDVEVDYRSEALDTGDILLLTTDGIHDFLSQDDLIESFSQSDSLDEVAQSLVEKALKQGSNDNLTCVVCRVDEVPAGDQAENLQRLAELRLPPDLYPGQILDGYRILEALHASKRSQLYLAEDTQSEGDSPNHVVIKTPSINFEDDPDYLEGFMREEWIGRRVQHPSVMKVFAPKPGRQFLYHTCEYIRGQTLRSWMQDNPKPSLTEVRGIVQQIITAIRGLHRLQILHQDLKPENLMFDQEGRLKLIDFGSARVAGDRESQQGSQTELPQGTKNYTAPEYFLDGNIDERADQFAIGVMAYELLTGELPYPEHSGSSIRVRHYQHMKYRPANQSDSSIPSWIDSALAKAVAADPAKRYPALSEFLQDLKQPNSSFQSRSFQPLIERNPVLTWQLIALLLLIINLIQYSGI
ncbi:bifunctional protein-serine/threonine kinase/phosphatase [Endozoicomonas arenosclerae]|uniref:bifunctional protein-serine/threonine kinase/phosphatase n=1 Tax=Endozoicomonas arenosclerae TaxID=1633495 RepID=UPI000A4F140C|nr:bifunctional protein-serine/threonine kinase/phosphatase [Endozoicomonas arenosclerae]